MLKTPKIFHITLDSLVEEMTRHNMADGQATIVLENGDKWTLSLRLEDLYVS